MRSGAKATDPSTFDIDAGNLLIGADGYAEPQSIPAIAFRHPCRIRYTIFLTVGCGENVIDRDLGVRQHALNFLRLQKFHWNAKPALQAHILAERFNFIGLL